MNKVIYFFLIISFPTIQCIAQNDSTDKDSVKTQKISLFLSYLSLSSSFESHNSIDLGLMKTIGPHNAIGGELGYIYDIEGFDQQNADNLYTDTYGIKAYFYYRFFLNIKENYPHKSLTFFDIEPQFYWASFKSERIAGFSCNEQFGDCEYYRFYDSRVNRIAPGLNAKIGKIYDYDPFYIKLFLGIGYRYVQEYSELKNQLAQPDKFFNRRGQVSDLQTGGLIRLRIGLQLAYNIWK